MVLRNDRDFVSGRVILGQLSRRTGITGECSVPEGLGLTILLVELAGRLGGVALHGQSGGVDLGAGEGVGGEVD